MATFFHHDSFTDNTCKLAKEFNLHITKAYMETGASVPLMSWSVIEPAMYLIAACLLTLRPILRKLSTKDLGSRLRNSAIFRKINNSKSDGSQDSHRKSQLPRGLASGFVELHDRHDHSDPGGERHLPPKESNVDPSRQLYDVEQGFVAPVHHSGA